MKLNGVDVTGEYRSAFAGIMNLSGHGSARRVPINVTIDGSFVDPHPKDTTQPSTLKGSYGIHRSDQEYTVADCKDTRAFTATR
ncbi:hypothetical protein HPC49_06515 [Pyxidicoccus fallax]|uniref:Uncharacterized protein n=1 Tax=Pyxidicoccus fallax TaxID=394095 RepID=A0A848LI51_9BACT|nr:hypothetical protein [Pyxidicoccus fallax]NMO17394.1 hypothetical protein [Pyxidicoccus fallax]NPC77907.1 hypothetical protein [Pyxidicoccus fallax]